MYSTDIKFIRKRDGRLEPFDPKKIEMVIFAAARAVGGENSEKAREVTRQTVSFLEVLYKGDRVPTVENVQDLVEKVLIESGHAKTAKAYIIYREQHAKLRQTKVLLKDAVNMVDDYIQQKDWRVKENANMGYSLQGLNNFISNAVSNKYWLSRIYPADIAERHIEGDIHIHDLGSISAYCCGWDLKDLLIRGFGGAYGKVESNPPRHFRVALGQAVNFFYTLQGEAAGAQAFSNFDTLLAPFVYYDKLTYPQVKQYMQEFIFNINVPTRVGFQCMSEDTEILGINGWKKYRQIKKGDTIATFNLEKGFIEYLPVKKVFAKKYKGKMYNLRNRISDQLISPEHRVVRRKFHSKEYVLEPIESILKLKSPFIIPVGSDGNVMANSDIPDDVVKLAAWVISEGSIDKGRRGSGRISIYQSKERSRENYDEIIDLCERLKLDYTERMQSGIGQDCNIIRFNAVATRRILKYFGSDKTRGIKFIPEFILNTDTETSRFFLETYIRGDGYEGCKILTTSKKIKDGLLQVIVNAGFAATVSVRKPDNKLSKKDRYIIRIIRHKDTYINKATAVDYEGIIWCPNTDNETVIARRNGKIFITGNTPFTNITMDLVVPKSFKNEAAIVGGEVKDKKYGDFQHEADLINKAFCEIMSAGDAKGRIFSFPIPTYNITKDFDWDNPDLDGLWEMTAKYGIPYFSNFVNSDMDPDDARSMCCRLRLDNRELRKRGGGLFGSNPLTGSIGVITLNIPRLAYMSGNKENFYNGLDELLRISKEALEIKRKVLEEFTKQGLYPYSKHYLADINKRHGSYWANHFSTIGLVGVNEACLNLMKEDISTPKGRKFALELLNYIRDRMIEFQKETGHMYNLEATPAEGTTYRLAKMDKEKYPGIITQGDKEPYYTNSSNLSVKYTDDIFAALDHQDEIQSLYTGGTVFHMFLGERIEDSGVCKKLVRKVAETYKLPYYTITPTFTICSEHGYIPGEHFECPYHDCSDEKEKAKEVLS